MMRIALTWNMATAAKQITIIATYKKLLLLITLPARFKVTSMITAATPARVTCKASAMI